MKAVVLILILISCLAVAEEKRSLGKSPDGKFELILEAEKPNDYGWVVIKNISSGKVTETETAQGYNYFLDEDIEASWKDDSTAFAIRFRGTKTTSETDIYFKDGEVWERINFPPFVANILGRQGVFSKGRDQDINFYGFEGESRMSLICYVQPDFQQKEETKKFKDWQPSTNTEWKVVLEYQRRTSPNCKIVSIEPFSETNSEQANAVKPATRSEPKSEGKDKPQPESKGRSQ